MGMRELIAESEAASFAGVSVRTFRRFRDSGYLTTEYDADGLALYDKDEVGKLFGIAREITITAIPHAVAAAGEVRNEKVIDLRLASAVGAREAAVRPAAMPQLSGDTETAYSLLETEIEKMKHVLELQERLLEERERELHQVMSERDWLRKRVERLEEQNERDQILLLSETQTVRKLVNVHVQRRSPVKALLNWLGLETPQAQLPVLPE